MMGCIFFFVIIFNGFAYDVFGLSIHYKDMKRARERLDE